MRQDAATKAHLSHLSPTAHTGTTFQRLPNQTILHACCKAHNTTVCRRVTGKAMCGWAAGALMQGPTWLRVKKKLSAGHRGDVRTVELDKKDIIAMALCNTW